MRVSPSQNIQYSEQSLSENVAVQEEGVATHVVTANLRGVYQQSALPKPNHEISAQLTLQEVMQQPIAVITSQSEHLPESEVYAENQPNKLAVLLRQMKHILAMEKELSPSQMDTPLTMISDGYKTSYFEKITRSHLLAEIDQWLNTKELVNKFELLSVTEKPVLDRYDSKKLNLHNLALFLEVLDDLPKEPGTIQTSFSQRTFLEWVQLLYLSLFPSTRERQLSQKNQKQKSAKKQNLFEDENNHREAKE